MDIITIKLMRKLGLALLCAGMGLGLLFGGWEVAAQKTVTVCASGCDFDKIQTALDAAAAGDTVDVKAGTYLENLTIRNKQDLTLQGAGRDQVTLDGNAPNQRDIVPGIFITGSRNITIKGFRITNSRRGLEVSNSSLLFIEANAFEKNLRQGIFLLRSEARIVGNLIQGTQVDLDGSFGRGIDAQNGAQITLTDNTITESADCGLHLVYAEGQPSQGSGSNNTIQNNKGGDLCGNVPLSILAQPPAEGTLEQVTVPTDVPSIQEAVNQVKAGGTITLNAGTYQEQVQIYKSLTIRGYGADVTVLQAPGPEWVAINIATDQIQVTLEGLKVTGGRRGVNIETGAGATVTLRNVKVEGNGGGKWSEGGLWIMNQGAVLMDQTDISSNQGNGLVILDAKLTIQNSTISQNSDQGVAASRETILTIESSTIADNFVGVVVQGNSRATIEGNTITRNKEEGIWLGDSAQAEIVNNQITDNQPDAQGRFGDGIEVVHNTKATIRDNTIVGNAHFGIGLWNATQATILNNIIENNISHGINIGFRGYANETVQAEISNNKIRNNLNCGVSTDNDAGIRITGQGNTISGNLGGNLCGDTSKFPSGFGG